MRAPVLLSLTALSVLACRPADQRTESIDAREQETRSEMSREAVAQLDSGNAAFRADDFEGALAHYRRVSELEPRQSSGWFGLYMAHHALGDLDAADSALVRARALAPGASLIHPTARDTLP